MQRLQLQEQHAVHLAYEGLPFTTSSGKYYAVDNTAQTEGKVLKTLCIWARR